jgi:DNA-binding Xre family transcriptional regulator
MAHAPDHQGASITLVFNLFDLKQRLQLLLKREISLSQIARESSLHRNTIERIFHNKTDRIDLETIGKLMLYFQKQGLDVQPGDFFLVEYP